LLPQAPAELGILLDAYLLDRGIYEIGYELNNRPEWTQIPLKGLLERSHIRQTGPRRLAQRMSLLPFH
jgi:predicted trehalose synthase